LVNLADGKTIYSHESKHLGSYNASLSDFSTFAAEGDARSRSIRQLAQNIFMRLAGKLNTP
jgi:hypothetical protein